MAPLGSDGTTGLWWLGVAEVGLGLTRRKVRILAVAENDWIHEVVLVDPGCLELFDENVSTLEKATRVPVFGVSKVEASSGLEATAVWHEKDIARLEASNFKIGEELICHECRAYGLMPTPPHIAWTESVSEAGVCERFSLSTWTLRRWQAAGRVAWRTDPGREASLHPDD